ncbi:MAG: hypothetical protein EOO63_07610 [Hymenobacter sp.]|nr:MAG: hypothetical protein EOO63_07610 [Hymenobacter sp.]
MDFPLLATACLTTVEEGHLTVISTLVLGRIMVVLRRAAILDTTEDHLRGRCNALLLRDTTAILRTSNTTSSNRRSPITLRQ